MEVVPRGKTVLFPPSIGLKANWLFDIAVESVQRPIWCPFLGRERVKWPPFWENLVGINDSNR